MSEHVNVAFIVNSLRFGGAEKHTLELFNGLDSRRFRKGLIYLKREEHLLDQVDCTQGELWCADFNKGWDFVGLQRLANKIRKTRPDLLVCVNTYPLFYGHLARWLSGHRCQIVEIFHSTKLPQKEERQMCLVYRRFFNRSDCIVYVSENQRAYWEGRGICKDNGIVVHNGVDTEYFCNWYSSEAKLALRDRFGFTSSDFIIGICAALRPEKQHEDLVEAIARLKSGGLNAKCLIIGDGPRRAAIKEKTTSIGLENDVFIAGFQTDVRSFVAACDCMAIVSHQETFSIAALEAMAMGKPLVMSAIGGAAEQVQDGVNGYFFPVGDVNALAEALHKLADSAHREEMGKKAREVVERDFGLNTMLHKYARLFWTKVMTDTGS
ncbi:MAG: glycosyltransferase [Candidatus Thiodiazotropha endolucinida]